MPRLMGTPNGAIALEIVPLQGQRVPLQPSLRITEAGKRAEASAFALGGETA